MEASDRGWFFLKNEVFDWMMEFVMNNQRDLVNDAIVSDGNVYEDIDEWYTEDVLSEYEVNRYLPAEKED